MRVVWFCQVSLAFWRVFALWFRVVAASAYLFRAYMLQVEERVLLA